MTKPDDLGERLRQDLLARHGKDLLLLETRRDQTGRETVVVVLDSDPDAGEIEYLTRRYGDTNGGTQAPRFEVLDGASFAAIRRLVDAGVLKFAAGEPRQLHRGAGSRRWRAGPRASAVGPRRCAVYRGGATVAHGDPVGGGRLCCRGPDAALRGGCPCGEIPRRRWPIRPADRNRTTRARCRRRPPRLRPRGTCRRNRPRLQPCSTQPATVPSFPRRIGSRP